MGSLRASGGDLPKVVPMWLVVLGFLAVVGGQLETGFWDPQACPLGSPAPGADRVLRRPEAGHGARRLRHDRGEGGEAVPHDDEQEGEPDQGPPEKAEHRSQVLPRQVRACACPPLGLGCTHLALPISAPSPGSPPGQSHSSTLNPYGTALGGQA